MKTPTIRNQKKNTDTNKPAPTRSSKGVRKEERQRVKRVSWAAKISRLATANEIDKISRKAPLQHFEVLRSTLENIEQDSLSQKPASKADVNRKKVKSAGGRSLALEKERMQFMRVLKHPEFKRNPVEAIQQHISATINKLDSNKS